MAGFFAAKPLSHQSAQSSACKYLMKSSTCIFDVGPYDKSMPLTIDPAVLVYAGYIGGSGYDYASGVAVDTSGNAYVAGLTNSDETTFPILVGPDLTYNGFGGDAFVAK